MVDPSDKIEYVYFDMDAGKEITREQFDALRPGTVYCSGMSPVKKPVLLGFTRCSLPIERLFNLAKKRAAHASHHR